MKLAAFQRLMAADVMRPLNQLNGIAAENVASYIKPNDILSPVERLEIYNRSYWYRILDSLYEDFPGLRAVLGDESFTKLSEAYLTEWPSRSFTMGNLGQKLELWLRANPEWGGTDIDLALDMVRLEWAHIEAFERAELKAIGPEDLAEFDSRLELGLQPYVRLLDLQYPVDELRLQMNAISEGQTTASNTVLEKCREIRSDRPVRLARNPKLVAVHRFDGVVYYRSLEEGEFAVLKSLERGGRFGTVMARALHSTAMPAEEFHRGLEGWFSAWAQLGWICGPNRGASRSGR